MEIKLAYVQETPGMLRVTFAKDLCKRGELTPAGVRAMRILTIFTGRVGYTIDGRVLRLEVSSRKVAGIKTTDNLRAAFERHGDTNLSLRFWEPEVWTTDQKPRTMSEVRKIQAGGTAVNVSLSADSNFPFIREDETRLARDWPNGVLGEMYIEICRPYTMNGTLTLHEGDPWKVARQFQELMRKLIR